MSGQNTRTVKTLAAAILLVCLIPSIALAGFISSTLGTRQAGAYRFISIGEPGNDPGISHDLDPDDWFMYRVRILHEDGQFPLVGYTSDNFAPTANDIQLCDDTGCEAPEINAGVENLDWSDESKVTVILEAKECLLCTWEGHVCDFE